MAPAQLGLYARSNAQQERANVQFHVQALSLDRFGTPLHRFPAITTSVCNAHPTSRGQVRLRDPHPTSAPIIDPNYLSTAADQQVIVDALRLARRIVAQPALARYQPQEMLPGPSTSDDDAALLKAAAEIALTIFHPVGTARMGLEDDAMAVLDARLRVIGIDGLRVIDASAMPDIPSGNTAAASMMIAEKGAAMLLADHAP
jgi:choline dehydrogenase-like flavoprotein